MGENTKHNETDETPVARVISRSEDPEAAAAVEGTWPLPEQRAAAKRYAEELQQREDARQARRKG